MARRSRSRSPSYHRRHTGRGMSPGSHRRYHDVDSRYPRDYSRERDQASHYRVDSYDRDGRSYSRRKDYSYDRRDVDYRRRGDISDRSRPRRDDRHASRDERYYTPREDTYRSNRDDRQSHNGEKYYTPRDGSNRHRDDHHASRDSGRDVRDRHNDRGRRSASFESACSFGSQVSFGGDHEVEEVAADADEPLDEEAMMRRAMGFTEFSTTKNKQHLDTDVSGVAKRSKRQYRQYMNRRGGFNRPLSPTF
ncbi:hypothetical protein BBOV_III002760 [Babesia bovis T2Bo]|uniref:U4/U6.U5 small nuclear ribonucleoprotein 27kDa protein domain-containing protein n=1 Tax=Babesia bovis TaxID=5865 RepID=A7AMQ7_BABBO|nr:hypothetical protein BBOV_III002760 [Babesia bovis T2Bo]EDO07841.1 hypothetical protein BBOV_III002760 [Babesia bovis T2Bo]|eukprot:XP_001611409.1 hypothetical protein [Babesia bovis T2Bo]